jgi:hypothetical protein
MDSTNNQIYKYAKYLDKYTKHSNKDRGIYLQKLNRYLHNVQHGGVGEGHVLVQQIQQSVDQVIDTDKRTMANLLEILSKFIGIQVTEEDYQFFVNFGKYKPQQIAEKAYQIADINDLECIRAIIDGSITSANYNDDLNIEELYADLKYVPYFKENFLNCVKVIKALLQMKLIALMLTTEKIENKDNKITTCKEELLSIEKILAYLLTVENLGNLLTTDKLPEKLSLESVRTIVQQQSESPVQPASPVQQPASPVQQPAQSTRAQGGIASSTQFVLNPQNPTTKKFDIIGFTINKDGKPVAYAIPLEQVEKVLELLPRELKNNRDQQMPIELLPKDKNTHARVTFTNSLSIIDTLNAVKNEIPKKVQFTTPPPSSKPLNVYLFIVPMTYPINEQTKNREYYEAINEIEKAEMAKIHQAMNKQAEQRKQAQRQTPAP